MFKCGHFYSPARFIKYFTEYLIYQIHLILLAKIGFNLEIEHQKKMVSYIPKTIAILI